MNILFRTAGGSAKCKQLGLGHIFRCVNLAKNLPSHNIHFMIEDYGKAKKVIKENGFNQISILSKNIEKDNEIKKIKKYIQREKISIVIIDRFQIKKSISKNIKKFAKIVVISDLNKIDYDADLIVNGFIGFKSQAVKNHYGSRCLLGPKYQILNNEFSMKNYQNNKKRDILATFGGYDEHNIGKLFLNALRKNKHNKFKIKLILGPSTKFFPKKFSIDNNQQLEVIESTKNMANEMKQSKYGLCSGGLTTYEFASLGIPFGIICQNRHQLITAKEWEKKKIGVNLGLLNNKTPHKIEYFLDLISKKKLKERKNLVCDGLGTKRVVNEILKL